MLRLTVIATVLLSFTSCTGFASLTEDLNKRQVNSCIEARIVVGSVLTGGNGSAHVISGTGGMTAQDCAKVLQGQ